MEYAPMQQAVARAKITASVFIFACPRRNAIDITEEAISSTAATSCHFMFMISLAIIAVMASTTRAAPPRAMGYAWLRAPLR